MIISLEERIVQEANYLLDNNATIRTTAKHFGLSKSTIHKDLSYKLPQINSAIYEEVKHLLITNFISKHLRGGLSTKQKYFEIKKP